MGKWLKALAFISLTPIVTTCKPLGTNSGFDVTLSGNQVVLINAPSSSCQALNTGTPDTSIAAVSFQMQNMTVTWTNTKFPLTIQWVEFIINSPDVNSGQTASCLIAATDLLNAWVQSWNVKDPNTNAQICATAPVPVTVAPQAVTFGGGISNPAAPACDQVALTSFCPFKCGGIKMTNEHRTSSGAMTIKVYATYDSGGGNLVPLLVTKTVTYFFQGT